MRDGCVSNIALTQHYDHTMMMYILLSGVKEDKKGTINRESFGIPT